MKNELIYSKNKVKVFRNIDDKNKGLILLNLPKLTQKEILHKLSDKEILNFLKYLDLDEATDVLQQVKLSRQKKLLLKLEKNTKKKIKLLLKFDPETAAGLMTLDYIKIESDSKVKDVIKAVKKHELKTGKFPVILVVKNSKLVGELPGHYLARLDTDDVLIKHVKKVPTVKHNIKSKELIKIFRDHPNDKLVVLDRDSNILGIVFSHDVLKVLDEFSIIRKFAGVSTDENIFDPAPTKVKHRYKWLILNLFTAFLAASVVDMFKASIAKYVVLAVYMPIIAGMGGNTATQTLAVLVRGIALKEISLNKNAMKVIINEMVSGVMNGLITGSLAGIIAYVLNQNIMLGVIIFLAMVINMLIATFSGAIIPLFLKKLGKDPATSASIFITTVTDIMGFMVFLGLASLLL